MSWLNKLLDKLFDWVTPENLADENCPHCRGMGYDASGYTCTCVMEKK